VIKEGGSNGGKTVTFLALILLIFHQIRKKSAAIIATITPIVLTLPGMDLPAF